MIDWLRGLNWTAIIVWTAVIVGVACCVVGAWLTLRRAAEEASE